MSDDTPRGRPPRENLFRATFPAIELRGNAMRMPTLTGHFAVFNEWTEINSMWEGNFLERIAPGAFRKTFSENIDAMRVLFQHGQDPQIGDKPLGSIDALKEDRTGAYYEVSLLDTAYNRDILPGLEAGLYGASFRFRVMREEFVEEPEPSAYNPRALSERTVKEAQVMEFGPVTFPAYASATAELASAGTRSITDVIHDVQTIGKAAPILLDEERLTRAQAFVARAVAAPPEDGNPEDRAPIDADPADKDGTVGTATGSGDAGTAPPRNAEQLDRCSPSIGRRGKQKPTPPRGWQSHDARKRWYT